MKEITLFEVGDFIWTQNYDHAKRTESIIGPVRVNKIRPAKDSEVREGQDDRHLFVYETVAGSYYQGFCWATREEAEERVFQIRKSFEEADERERQAALEKLEAEHPKKQVP